MSNKEIVQKGLDARKNVRAAEARAERYLEEAANQRDARFYERNKWRVVANDWQQEKTSLLWQIADLKNSIRALVKERDELIQRERQVLADAAKAICLFVLATGARDLGWIVPGLAGAIMIAAIGCLVCAAARLTRNK